MHTAVAAEWRYLEQEKRWGLGLEADHQLLAERQRQVQRQDWESVRVPRLPLGRVVWAHVLALVEALRARL